MDYAKRNRQIANSYYNLGLEQAKVRNLTDAAENLKKSLRFDKYQMDARNLLGLIFYEMGETADALVQWVISKNLQAENNPADRYLDKIQRKPGQLEREAQTIKNYNQALWYTKNKTDDLAVLQLIRAVEDNPHFIKAHMLLALIYLSRKDYAKAKKSLSQILQIDCNNPRAQYYMSMIKPKNAREKSAVVYEDTEKRKPKNAFSHRKIEDDDTILLPAYKETTGWGSILNIITGLVIGMLAIFFLVMPALTKSLNVAHNQELISYSQKISNLNQQLDEMTAQYESLNSKANAMEEQLAIIDADNQAVIRQYQTIVGILQAYRSNDLMSVAQLYAALDTSLIQDEGVVQVINAVTQDMMSTGYQTLEDLGTASWNGGKLEEAVQYYEKSLQLKPDNPAAMYLLGRVYQRLGNDEQANLWLGRVIDEYPDSRQAEQAKTARGY